MTTAWLARLWVVACLAVILASPAFAQPPTVETPPATDPTEPTWSGPLPGVDLPGVLFPPGDWLDLILNIPPMQGPLVVMPSITISEEYNDNARPGESGKQSDFITEFAPSLALHYRQREFNLIAAYTVTGEIHANESDRNNFGDRQRFRMSMLYQPTERLTLRLSDGFRYDQNSDRATESGISSGRRETLSNILGGGLDYQLTQRLTWHISAAYTLERFGGGEDDDGDEDAGGASRNSDVYRAGTRFGYAMTPRLGLTAGYDFAFFDIEGENTATTHTPRVGVSYQFTPTVSASVSGGPSFLITEDDTSVTPAANARVTKTFSWGSMSAFYDRAINTSGGLGGVADRQAFGGIIAATTLQRGLAVNFSPRYTMTKTESDVRTSADVDTLHLHLGAIYQIARYVAIVGGYTFLSQRGDGDSSSRDTDQNRVTVGIRFGYPISVY